jgi:hypothetical protein
MKTNKDRLGCIAFAIGAVLFFCLITYLDNADGMGPVETRLHP